MDWKAIFVPSGCRVYNEPMRSFAASVWQEDGWFVAQCLDVDVASQGETEGEAVENLKEALQLHFTPPVATVLPKLASIQIEIHAA